MTSRDIKWVPLKDCAAIGDYELTVERYKHNWECEKHTDAWRWFVVYGGAVMSEGFADDMTVAKAEAVASLPEMPQE